VSEEQRCAVRLRMAGRVQGVWFRAWAREQALLLGLDGWVRNRADGTVEAVLAGPRDKVERMVALCRRGPPAARVEKLTREPETGEVPAGFRERPTV
jgi:acylphosphatase